MWIGKSYEFCAAHFIPDHTKCGKMHGHSYKVEIQVEGRVQPDGFVLDYNELNSRVRTILEPLDHNCLNEVIANPTCENLAHYIWKELTYRVPSHIREVKVRVQEGPFGGWAECERSL